MSDRQSDSMKDKSGGAEKVVGVLGGMGPEATADFFQKLLKITPARSDQEHLRILIDCNAKIPDRMAAILGDGEDPTPVLQSMARGLQSSGAELIVIPCNTAHYYHQAIQEAVQVPVLHIQREMFKALMKRYPGLQKAGLLATTATIRTKLFQSYAEQAKVELLTPETEDQEGLIMAGIRATKAGDKETARTLVHQAARRLRERGVEALIAGCTEIPLVLQDGDVGIPVLDSTQILAEATLAAARQVI